jgi:alpha-beta hydrolase superfamily lysophospholipase
MVSFLAVLLGTAYLAVGALLWAMQDKILFPAPGGIGRDALDAAAAEIGAQPIDLVAADGVRLYGWHLVSTGSRVVLYLHGNGERVSDYAPLYRILMRQGWDVVVVAYRGYPGSDPVGPTQEGLALDARAAWDWTVGPGGYAPDRVVVHGRSLGGGVACMLVEGEANPAGLVLESTFSSVRAVAKRRFPIYPVDWLLRNPFDSVDLAPRLGVPVLVLESRDDQVIPIDLSAKAMVPVIAEVEYHETAGWSHQDCLPVADREVRTAYLSFLERTVPR